MWLREAVIESISRNYSLFDWTRGVHDRASNPLAPQEASLAAGENIDISNAGLAVRNGLTRIAAEAFSDPVVYLESVRLPTSGATYLIAQTLAANSPSRIYAATLPAAPFHTLEWTRIYNLGVGANVISMTALNDRVILTEGAAAVPLVFAGCLDPSGSDWAAPLAAMFTIDGGENWIDVSDSALDTDAESIAEIESGPGSGLIQLAICVDTPVVTGLFFDVTPGDSGVVSLNVEAYSGAWLSVENVSDGTAGLSQSGVITWPSDQSQLKATSINGVEGFWIRLVLTREETAAFSLRRILFRAPCQPLSVLGNGAPDSPLGFLFWDESAKSAKDFTIEVQDFTYPSFARLNDGDLESPQAMGTEDFIYIGYLTAFSSVELTVHNDYHNVNASSVAGSYWNGQGWSTLTNMIDGTANEGSVTLSKRGKVSWDLPDDWKPNRPISGSYPYGYWIRLAVSSELTARTFISEAGVTPVFDPLKKYRFAITVRDRVILLNRSDSCDRIEISRPLEEYGFSGADSAYLRIGGTGDIVAAIEVFNQGFIAKTDDWYLLNGYSPPTFSVERAEAAGQAPINNRVLVRAPHMESDSKNLMGLYYINQRGAWHFAGLKVYRISDQVSWWDMASNGVKIDVRNLGSACGVYWASRNWVIWAVPMITGSENIGANNRLIIYDLNLGAWLPPFAVSASSLATVSTHSPAGAAGGVTLLAGNYHGGVSELFTHDSYADGTEVVRGWAETPWLHFGAPNVEKSLRVLTAIGWIDSQERLRVEIFTDGVLERPCVVEFNRLAGSGADGFGLEQKSLDAHGRFFKFRIKLNGNSRLYGLQASILGIREWGAM